MASLYPSGVPTRVMAGSEELPERVPTGSPEPVVGEVPQELMQEMMVDLRARLDSPFAAFEILRAEQVIWNDGSLGCPQPGRFYTQATVEGYWVVLGLGEELFDYRASRTGYFFICANPLPHDAGILPDK